jgi:gliding motility associated protien GldN
MNPTMKKIIFLLPVFAIIGLMASAQQVLDTPPLDGVYVKNNIAERKPITYPYVREADVMWSKRIWRVIELKEKMNQAFYYPEVPHNNWRSFMTVLMDGIKEGTITAYDASSSTDEFIIPVTKDELMKRMEKTDTISMQRSYPPYDYFDTIMSVKFEPTDIKRLRIKEDIFFDKQRSVTEIRIIGICPVKDNVDPKTGEFRGYQPLFWVNFPEARPLLAKAEVFNRQNSAQKMTYDDLFWKRLFDSYIYKEENVYDRKIDEYATGIDALLESERIKNELFMFEQNLWEY